MSVNPEGTEPRPQPDQREDQREPESGPRHALYAFLRLIARHVRGFWGAIAAFLTAGMVVFLVATAAFALLAGIVEGGVTQNFDERVLRWVEGWRTPALDDLALEITTLGDGVVIIMMVAVASVFLWLTHHRWSVYVLVISVLGGKLLNNVLKMLFARDRPSVVEALDPVRSMSFPSGHAMAAIIGYGTIAYLVSRLEPTRRLRLATWSVAAILILAIGISRIYLGVHYPSDVLAGFIGGLAWLAFVAAAMTAIQFFAPRRPETEAEEKDLHRQT